MIESENQEGKNNRLEARKGCCYSGCAFIQAISSFANQSRVFMTSRCTHQSFFLPKFANSNKFLIVINVQISSTWIVWIALFCMTKKKKRIVWIAIWKAQVLCKFAILCNYTWDWIQALLIYFHRFSMSSIDSTQTLRSIIQPNTCRMRLPMVISHKLTPKH